MTARRIVIVGAGPGGLCLGAKLREAGFEDFVILERADGVGGTWRRNAYPGAACDIPSHLYSFSFDQKADWSRAYAAQPEILEYLEGFATRHGLREHLHFGVTVRGASWDDRAARWEVRTDTGPHTGEVLVGAVGMFNERTWPDLPGLRSFRGVLVHSAEWDAAAEPDRPGGGGDREWRERSAVGAHDCAGGRPPVRVPTPGPMDPAEGRSRVHRRGAGALPRRPFRRRADPGGDLRPRRGIPHVLRRARAPRGRAFRSREPLGGRGPRRAPQAPAGRAVRVPPATDLQRLLRDVQPAPRRAGDGADRARDARRDRDGRWHAATRRHDRLRNRLRHDEVPLGPRRVRPGRPQPAATRGPTARRRTGESRSRAIPTSSCSTARTPTTARSCT